MLMGEYHHNIDDKGRIIIPSKLRDELGDIVIATRGLDNCIFIYKEEQWKNITSKLQTLPFTKKDARNFTRIFLSGATLCEFDKQGRIKLPLSLCSYALLDKECIIIGVNDRLEIWSRDKWNDFFNDNNDSLSDMADHLFESDFGD